MKTGIDRIGFYTPPFYLPLATLAEARGIDPDKFHLGLGQYKMAVIPPDESVVSMAANAAESILNDTDKSQIGMVLFATESGVDQSKAGGIFVHSLLGLPKHCRVLELKQACYSATGALQLANSWLLQHPEQKVLLLASDIARYGLGSAGEPSQGGGAVAMLISTKPRILAIEPQTGLYTSDVMDFWRPNYRDEALVEGKYSCEIYLKALEETWDHYSEQSQRNWQDHQQFLYHIPFPRLAEKAHQQLRTHLDLPALEKDTLRQTLNPSLEYSRQTGNCYTGSLYLGLTSLLDQHQDDLGKQRIGFYSYGSGCVAEYFSGVMQPGYRAHLCTEQHQKMLAERHALTMEEYERFYRFHGQQGQPSIETPKVSRGKFRFAGVKDHKRIYTQANERFSAQAPGKLILAGEHAVVHGAPALVTAVDRYTTATITPDAQGFSFELKDIEHAGTATLDKLRQMKHRLQDAHQKFIRGERGIRDVIQKPFELLHYTATNTIDRLSPNRKTGFKVKTDSTIPIGCGMGSSAASIVSTNFAITHFLGERVDDKSQYELNLAAENLQHGRSSGIDLHVSMHGGCHWFQQGQAERCPNIQQPLLIVNTGRPKSTTGECVTHTSAYFDDHPDVLGEFTTTVEQMRVALGEQNQAGLIQAIRNNHALLVQIGVVPERVQAFINAVIEAGGAGKVCGAGSITDDQAGIVWLVGNQDILQPICEEYGYTLETLQMATQGVTLTTA